MKYRRSSSSGARGPAQRPLWGPLSAQTQRAAPSYSTVDTRSCAMRGGLMNGHDSARRLSHLNALRGRGYLEKCVHCTHHILVIARKSRRHRTTLHAHRRVRVSRERAWPPAPPSHDATNRRMTTLARPREYSTSVDRDVMLLVLTTEGEVAPVVEHIRGV